MNLKEELRQLSNEYDGISYDKIVKILKGVAGRGERCREFDRKDVSENTAKKLREEGLTVEIQYITNEFDKYETNCCLISW
ncbi:hypothetical protein G8V07_12545 [Clostridium botulinum D/C]|uniref:hypothetical protein n=1 Tax=Clostridium botulinum TaxID=1491 RepID=UPI001E2C4371|nr:hypothetical protein [Clostridium botulinum]MCD3321138.1 hypothetical protein [Clostridium botulinum D/C]MCD3324578.1 hypothetical protein [Clostridium botulinum D/C]MCD3326856.1 hypothetical protein [Clostridium botulinum D/C]